MLLRVVACALATLSILGSRVAVAPAAERGPFWWEPPEALTPSGTEIESIACPSAQLCVATAAGNMLTSTDPAGGPSAWRVDHVDGGTFDWCAETTDCPVPPRSVGRGAIRLTTRATLVRPLRADVTVRRVQTLR